MSKHVRIGQDGKMLDSLGNIVVTRYVDAWQNKGMSEDASNVIKIHQGEVVDDGILYPARTITLGNEESIKLREALNTWIKDPDMITIPIPAISAIKMALTQVHNDSNAEILSPIMQLVEGMLSGTQG